MLFKIRKLYPFNNRLASNYALLIQNKGAKSRLTGIKQFLWTSTLFLCLWSVERNSKLAYCHEWSLHWSFFVLRCILATLCSSLKKNYFDVWFMWRISCAEMILARINSTKNKFVLIFYVLCQTCLRGCHGKNPFSDYSLLWDQSIRVIWDKWLNFGFSQRNLSSTFFRGCPCMDLTNHTFGFWPMTPLTMSTPFCFNTPSI